MMGAVITYGFFVGVTVASAVLLVREWLRAREHRAWCRAQAQDFAGSAGRLNGQHRQASPASPPRQVASYYEVESMALGQTGWGGVREAAREFEQRFPRETA